MHGQQQWQDKWPIWVERLQCWFEEQVKHTRHMRGECEDCGQKCFNKTMFKTIPVTIVGKVEEGRCLRCTT